ncbi:hypothetical protein C5167_047665 [Papaver somniferum]|uniref:WRKY domain-containing protein n=1 Tax=Papaver somniferum TaxID=3469 RepID=A0A4Y7LIV1_PAPSO|nr:probable WRKY transcription factor 30 isoform X1 [Papaver somniferum]RZC84877.1 hypothetical protein C5167_047665 [Papaver somniferum]
MEKNTSRSYMEQKPLILNELTQAKELLKQLESQLDAGNLLLPKILSSFEISLSMLSAINSEGGTQSQTTGSTESPRSVNGSRKRDSGSDLLIGNPSKKKKTIQRWTEQVRVCEQTGLEGHLDDGYGWRKYGQKDILGATYPRGYYRCTHRNAQGCLAMKQVQRSDEDPSMFSVTYRGRHTCIQAVHLLSGKSQNRHDHHDQKRMKSQGTLINFQKSCHNRTEDFNTTAQVVLNSSSLPSPSASVPIPSIEKENDNNNNNNFSSMTPDNHFMSSSFTSSPSTSVSNSSISPNSFGEGQSLQNSEFDLSEFTSTFDPTDLYLDFDFLDSICSI